MISKSVLNNSQTSRRGSKDVFKSKISSSNATEERPYDLNISQEEPQIIHLTTTQNTVASPEESKVETE